MDADNVNGGMEFGQPEPEERLQGLIPRLSGAILESSPRIVKGRVKRLLGVIIEATVKDVRIGEICHLSEPGSGLMLRAEVVGWGDGCAMLTRSAT